MLTNDSKYYLECNKCRGNKEDPCIMILKMHNESLHNFSKFACPTPYGTSNACWRLVKEIKL